MLPLRGIRVVELCTVLMGPYAAQVLADYGAEVIKVEAPPAGDSTRQTGPAAEPGMAAVFLGVNRGKRSILLDLKQAPARDALLRLIGTADVFLHNIRPQKLAALGLAPEPLLRHHPRLVYASLLGFGSGGPYAGRPAYDDVIQGMSGLAALMQAQSGEPRYLPTVAADKVSGLMAANAILAVLAGRECNGGRGGLVEVPMFESAVAFAMVEHLYGASFDPPLGLPGYPRALAPWRRPYRTADGHVCLMPYTDRHWRDILEAAGAPGLAADPRFSDIAGRTRHVGELYEAFGALVAREDTAHWLALCERLEIPAGPMRQLAEVLADPHLAATGFFEEVATPGSGTPGSGRLRLPGVPVRFDGQRPPVAPPPRLGADTEAVLAEAGLPPAEIAALLASGAARRHDPAPNPTEDPA